VTLLLGLAPWLSTVASKSGAGHIANITRAVTRCGRTTHAMQRGKIARRDRETPLSWLTEARNESSRSTCTTLVGKHAIRLQCQIRKQNHCPQLDTGRSSSGSKRAPVCREASSLPVGHVGTMCTIFEKFKVAKIVSGLDFFFLSTPPGGGATSRPRRRCCQSTWTRGAARSANARPKARNPASIRFTPQLITKLYLIGDRSSIYVSQPSRPDGAL
jgi:hypothetical protein